MSVRRSANLQVPTELALLAVSTATLAGFRRLFTDWSFFPRPFLLLVVSHVLAVLLRRRRVPLALAALVSAVGCLLVGTWIFYRSTTRLGLPTATTLDHFTADVREAIQLFRDVEAPAEPLRGFLVASGISFWITAFLADWSAFRLAAPFEAVLPAGGLFVFASLFGADQYRGASTVAFLVAVLGFLLLHRASRLETSAAWIRGDAARGSRALVRAGGALGVTALLVGVAVGPLVPGSSADPLLDWKKLGSSNGTRVTVSPLVDIQGRLVDQKDVEVFTVRSDKREYWRLTALDEFDGRVWKSSGRFAKVTGPLPKERGAVDNGETLRQDFRIDKLSQIWLPAAYEPRAVEGLSVGARFEPTTSTLIADKPSSDGLTYSVVSQVLGASDPTVAELETATERPPAAIRSQFLQLPDDFDPRVTALARQVTAGAATPYDKARALQDWFRANFTYSLQVPKGHGTDALSQFLFETRTGYCEQFAGSYAAMARAIGLPTRVAVGFTWGDQDPNDANLWHVTGKHAHAWPEVYLGRFGWMKFEPTPTRGAPDAGYTGVDPRQDSPVSAGELGPSVSTTQPPELPSGSASGLPVEPDPSATASGSTSPSTTVPPASSTSHAWAGWVLYVLAGLVVAYALAVLGARWAVRALRRRRARSTNARIDVAWREAVESLGILGLSSVEAETPREFVARAERRTRHSDPSFRQLAELATEARYSGQPASEHDVAAAREGAVAVLERVKADTTVAQRLGYELSPKLLVRRARRRGRRPRSHITS